MSKVNHPDHYGGDNPYEAIKIIEAHKLDFHLGNAVKYILRAGKKPGESFTRDLQKAIWYLERRIETCVEPCLEAPVRHWEQQGSKSKGLGLSHCGEEHLLADLTLNYKMVTCEKCKQLMEAANG